MNVIEIEQRVMSQMVEARSIEMMEICNMLKYSMQQSEQKFVRINLKGDESVTEIHMQTMGVQRMN